MGPAAAEGQENLPRLFGVLGFALPVGRRSPLTSHLSPLTCLTPSLPLSRFFACFAGYPSSASVPSVPSVRDSSGSVFVSFCALPLFRLPPSAAIFDLSLDPFAQRSQRSDKVAKAFKDSKEMGSAVCVSVSKMSLICWPRACQRKRFLKITLIWKVKMSGC